MPKTDRRLALIAPVTNLGNLVCGLPCPGQTDPGLGEAIKLDLGRRGIRSLECNEHGCLILAGPPTSKGNFPQDFRLYTWSGNPNDLPQHRSADLTNLAPSFKPEGIVALPKDALKPDSLIQLVSDDGDISASTFRSAKVELGDVVRLVNAHFLPPSSIETIRDRTQVPGGKLGTLKITATYTNIGSTDISNLFFEVKKLSTGLPKGSDLNLLLNAAGGPGGVGATLIPDVGAEGVLSVGESFTATFVIGLQRKTVSGSSSIYEE